MASPEIPSLEPATAAAFRREGAAILAQERGMTPSCRRRLTQTARSLGIEEGQIEAAIRSLSQAEPEAPPSAGEDRFRQRLRKDLGAAKRAIVGPTAEAKIFANASRKFGLDAAAAERILREVAAELGVTRITAGEAIDSLAAQIDQSVGRNTWLAREGWDRLRSAAATWGLELEIVDEMIDERLTANRAEAAKRQYWTKTTLVGAGAAVVVTALVIAGVALSRMSSGGSAGGESVVAVENGGSDRPASAPRWWDVDLSIDVTTARGRHKTLAESWSGIASPQAAERTAAYERLIGQLTDSQANADYLSAVKPVVAGCLALEADEDAASALQRAVIALLPSADGRLPKGGRDLDLALWAADALSIAARRRGATSQRKQALELMLTSAIGATPDGPSTDLKAAQRAHRQQTVLALYQQLGSQAARLPEQVAAVYPALFERAIVVLSEDQLVPAETNLLVAALPHAGRGWTTYERAIARCVASADPLPALRLLEALRRATDEALVEHLAKMLLIRSGAAPKSEAKRDIIAAVRKALGGSTASLSLADRWQQLADEVEVSSLVEPPPGREETIRRTLAAAHLATLAMALAQGEAGLATFDAGIERPLTLPPGESSEDTNRVATASGDIVRAVSSLSPSERREVTKGLESLGKRGASAERDRVSGWRRLAALAKELDDVPPAAAAQIAGHAVANLEAEERSVAWTALTQIGKWPHLRLALADAIGTAKTPAENLVPIVEQVTGQSQPAEATIGILRRALLQSVATDLAGGSSRAASGKLDQTANQLADTYRQRAALLGLSPAELATARSPAQSLELIARKLGSRPGEEPQVERQIKAARFVADSDLQQTIGLQRLVLEFSAERLAARRPEQAAAARRIAAQAHSASIAAPDALTQLFIHESAVLQVWLLYAPEV